MAEVTRIDVLEKASLEELQQQFYEQYNTLSYIPELFELIDSYKLRNWLIEQFSKDFSLGKLKRMFDPECDEEP